MTTDELEVEIGRLWTLLDEAQEEIERLRALLVDARRLMEWSVICISEGGVYEDTVELLSDLDVYCRKIERELHPE